MNNKDLAKYQEQINGMMKELTYSYEINNPEIRLSGETTEVSSDVDAFQLNPARKVREYYGNKIYVDRVKVPVGIKFQTLGRVRKKMIDDYTMKVDKSPTHFMSFKVSENSQEWCRQTEIGDLEIRLICKFEENA